MGVRNCATHTLEGFLPKECHLQNTNEIKEHLNKVDVILLEQKGSHGMIADFANIYFTDNDTYRTIAEAELPAFRAALEACYA